MHDKELWKKIREIEIKTNRLVSELFGGEYRSVFKGKGLDFKEFKEYEPGDDPRQIDWKVSAKKGYIHVKKFVEERELTLLLVLDISNSTFFGSGNQLKRELAAEFSASIAFSGMKNNDKVGLILFSDRVLEFIPPKKGRNHILRLLKQILSHTYSEEEGTKTNLAEPLKLINKVFRKKVIAFIISDFLAEDFENELKLVNYHHDLISVVITDQGEMALPDIGLIELEDPESKKRYLYDSSNPKTRQKLTEVLEKEKEKRVAFFKKNRIDRIFLNTNESFVKALTNFFKLREKRF
jgi:uncharacterized protein (DUF58 family)